MDTKLADYIDLVRDFTAEQLPDDLMLPQIVESARKLFADGFALDAEQRVPEVGRHGRHLLYEDDCSDFVVIAMVWPEGADSGIHDHGTWGVVGVLEGELEVTDYEAQGDGSLKAIRTQTIKPGDVDFVLPPSKELHRVRKVSSGISITVHTYGMAPETCNVFDEATGESTLVRPEYTTSVKLTTPPA